MSLHRCLHCSPSNSLSSRQHASSPCQGHQIYAYGPERGRVPGFFHVCCRLYFGQPFATEPIPTPRLPTMSTHRTVLDRELFVQSLRHMGEEDLLYLNRMVVERLNLLAQAKSTVALAQFAEGDRVQFTTQAGVLKQGKVMRLNKKTASLLTDDGEHWKVSPNLLRKLPQA